MFNQNESFSDKRNLKGDCFLLLQDQDTGTLRIQKRKEETVPCPEYQALVTCKNINRHIRNHGKDERLKATCVNESSGMFLVNKN